MCEKTEENERKVYLDILRILAIFLVLFTHTGEKGSKLYTIVNNNFLRVVYLYLDCFRTINNLLLFMISGALLLGKDESIKVVLKKRILRFVIILITFTYIQSLFQCICEHSFSDFNFSRVFIQLLENPIRNTYWYIYSYISFLIVLPILRKIAIELNYKMFIYMMILSIVSQDIFRIISCLLNIDAINITLFINQLNVLYPLLGFYMDVYYEELSAKYKYSIYWMLFITLLGLSSAVWFSLKTYNEIGIWSEKYITLFCTSTATTVFCVVRKITQFLQQRNMIKKVTTIKNISGAMFGIYLMENILECITISVYKSLNSIMPSIFACIIYLIVTMVIGTIIINLLKKNSLLKWLL